MTEGAPGSGLVVALAAGVYASVPLARQAASGGSKPVPVSTILAIEDSRAATRADLDILLSATRGPTRDVAIQALGRLAAARCHSRSAAAPRFGSDAQLGCDSHRSWPARPSA